jgi:hypothetical protein
MSLSDGVALANKYSLDFIPYRESSALDAQTDFVGLDLN